MTPQSPAPLLALSSELPELPAYAARIGGQDAYTAAQMRAYATEAAAYWFEMWRTRRDEHKTIVDKVTQIAGHCAQEASNYEQSEMAGCAKDFRTVEHCLRALVSKPNDQSEGAHP